MCRVGQVVGEFESMFLSDLENGKLPVSDLYCGLEGKSPGCAFIGPKWMDSTIPVNNFNILCIYIYIVFMQGSYGWIWMEIFLQFAWIYCHWLPHHQGNIIFRLLSLVQHVTEGTSKLQGLRKFVYILNINAQLVFIYLLLLEVLSMTVSSYNYLNICHVFITTQDVFFF